jgi:D-amino-acid N-acetyltransferase
MSASITIRSIQEGDREQWLALWEQYNIFYKRSIPQNVTDTTFARFLDDKIHMYCQLATLTSDTSKLVGFVTDYPHPSIATITEQVYLHDLFVDESIRSKGTGRKLIEIVYEYAKSIEAASMYWHT